MQQNSKGMGFFARLGKDLKKYSSVYVLFIPVLLYYLIFCYKPMYGILIAFQNFKPVRGVWGSEWVGLQHFKDFFDSYYFLRLIKNTLNISITSLICGFPLPIILALLLNEIKNEKFKRLTQTITYMPHFISTVIMCGMVVMFVAPGGFVYNIVQYFGEVNKSLLTYPEWFVPIYVISGIWQGLGWNSIIYLAALSGVDQELYEAAKIDGAGRWKQTLHVTLPGIEGTIIIVLLLNLGGLMSVGYEKIILLYNSGVYETADVISSFVYRKGLVGAEWSYGSAVGLFNSLINFFLVMTFNKISKKLTEISLW